LLGEGPKPGYSSRGYEKKLLEKKASEKGEKSARKQMGVQTKTQKGGPNFWSRLGGARGGAGADGKKRRHGW